jgi:phosphoribosylanthranilate isomerase
MNCCQTKIKICGITNIEDASKAVYYGAHALGFVFYKKSPRYISPSKARRIIEALPPFIEPVGIFVNIKERAVKDILSFTRIKTVQFHGDEDQVFCKRFTQSKIIKAFRVDRFFDPQIANKFKVDAYLFDAYQEDEYGGTGKTFNWDILKDVKLEKPVVLSGGLNPTNVKDAIGSVHPYCVDVSSGVEKSPGIKSPQLIREFCEAVRSV